MHTRTVSVHGPREIVYTVHASFTKGRPPPFRCPPAANLAGQVVRSYGTHFSASEVQQFGEEDKEET
jgi:hypothetical protein